ncbi:DUF6318 family protein [Paenarthrobacter sp. NPDC092416]|uniref:DUF6318 family protein n=1 Tax=Paenarthrobacter sp. NPDC092416 TaxID=3364386 RepID=UPI0038300F0D
MPVPVMPELAKENTKEGLEAFIRYWYATYSYATETGDLGPWSQATDTSTASALAYKRAIELNHVNGRWVMGGKITTPVIEVQWSEGAVSQSTKVQVIQAEIQYFDADGTTGQEPSPASNFAEAVISEFKGGSWYATDNGMIVS